MGRKRAKLSDLMNDLTYRVLYDKFRLLALTMFKWENLPDGILERHIETLLFEHGKAVFFRAPGMAHMCLEAQELGKYNVNGDPVQYRAYGYGYQKTLNANQCVIIENNMMRLPTKEPVMFYVNKIFEAERTMDVNVKANKTPVVFVCEDKDVLSFKHIFRQVDGGAPAIFADKSLNLDAITAFDTKAKFLGNDLMDYKRSVESDLLTFLGQNNSPIDKKERLITDEANSNNQLISSFCDIQLEARKRACEEINNMFGLNISVDLRQQPPESVENSVEEVENHDA